MNEVLRQEKKFLINLPQMYQLTGRLSQVLQEDPHNRGDGYLIRSLYFDSLNDRDYQEKEDGVELRRKIRLRTYGPDSSFALLEMKQKEGALQKKRSLRVTREDAVGLCQGDYSVLLHYPGPFPAECFALMHMHGYRPKTIVEYRRKAYIAKENKIRITFDHHITATESNFDIFSPQLLQTSVMDTSLVVLEVKFNGFLLSYIKDILEACNQSETSVSKYCLGRATSLHYTF